MLELLKNKVIFIVGATASGKSALAMQLAKEVNGIIINADSSQVYIEPKILTASPNLIDQKKIPHKLFNFIKLGNDFNVITWQNLVLNELKLAFENNLTPIIVGGSGFYISSLLNGLSPLPNISDVNKKEALQTLTELGKDEFFNLVNSIDPIFTKQFQDNYRLVKAYQTFLETGKNLSYYLTLPKQKQFNYQSFVIKLLPERSFLYNNINLRFSQMLNAGALLEAETIKNININIAAYKKVLGLTELIAYLENKISLLEATNLASQKTRNYAKRQITWFKHQLLAELTVDNSSNINILPLILAKIKAQQ